jgi:peptide/nickel transport system permease protein
MGWYLIQRVALTGVVIFLVVTTVFVLMRWLPGDPITLAHPEISDPVVLDRMRHELGFDKPLLAQYVAWLGDLATGNLGRSVRSRDTVVEVLLQRLPVTLQLGTVALVISLAVPMPLGIISATRPGSKADFLATVIALSGTSSPHFFLGILLIFLFAVTLRWLPPSGYADPLKDPLLGLKSLILPAITVGASMAAVTMRTLRASLLEVMGQEYVQVARAKGFQERAVVRRHALMNPLILVVTVVGLQIGTLLGGAVVVETIFALPGLGRLLVDALLAKDYFVVQGAVLLMALGFCVVNLLVDVLYSALDPRIRYG